MFPITIFTSMRRRRWWTWEPVLALRRDLDGFPSVIAVINMGERAVDIDLPDCASYAAIQGHGMAGVAVDGKLELPGYGAWFGMQS